MLMLSKTKIGSDEICDPTSLIEINLDSGLFHKVSQEEDSVDKNVKTLELLFRTITYT